jgi:hypothetical protein
VRAPNLSELYAPRWWSTTGVNNNQGNTVTIQQRTVGNTGAAPEIARNNIFGIVLIRPSWAPGFSARSTTSTSRSMA